MFPFKSVQILSSYLSFELKIFISLFWNSPSITLVTVVIEGWPSTILVTLLMEGSPLMTLVSFVTEGSLSLTLVTFVITGSPSMTTLVTDGSVWTTCVTWVMAGSLSVILVMSLSSITLVTLVTSGTREQEATRSSLKVQTKQSAHGANWDTILHIPENRFESVFKEGIVFIVLYLQNAPFVFVERASGIYSMCKYKTYNTKNLHIRFKKDGQKTDL